MKEAGDTLANITVLVLPPNESASNLVNFESLYGICLRFEDNASITEPNAVKLKFIFFPSSNVFPVAFVLPTLSLPAKSTKFNLPLLIFLFFSSPSSISKYTVNKL